MNPKHNSDKTRNIEQIIQYFHHWFKEEQKLSKVKIPTACCLSTIGLDGYPDARFISLKGIVENSFVVTGPLTSRKGNEIEKVSRVALTFWWTETERQVRIQGNTKKLPAQLADKYFSERNRDSQLVSIVSEQGQEIKNIETLVKKYEDLDTEFSGKNLTRPENWGGYLIEPIRVEFLEFKPTRFHDRMLFELINGQWAMKQIQP